MRPQHREIRRLRSVAALLVVCALLASACRAGTDPSSSALPAPSATELVVESSWASSFEQRGVAGTIAVHRLGSGQVLVHDDDRARRRFLPASTFKILNSLVALDTGVVTDVDDVVRWDGTDRGITAWNRDHSLRSGIEVSAVWMYQELARRIGPERMAARVEAAGYGNADIGGEIDRFWLDGELRISALEQLDVLEALLVDALPFEPDDQADVREILVRESGDGWVWGHKTGLALAADPLLGWLVGFTEYEGERWVFALNVDLVDATTGADIDPEVRQSISREILELVGALPPR